jgi:hypothetical protein
LVHRLLELADDDVDPAEIVLEVGTRYMRDFAIQFLTLTSNVWDRSYLSSIHQTLIHPHYINAIPDYLTASNVAHGRLKGFMPIKALRLLGMGTR